MKNTIDMLFGVGEHLTIIQLCSRALVMYVVTLLLIRLGGMRIFGKKSAFDTIIIIMLGAVLARGIVGASSFGGTIAAAALMIALDRLLAWLSSKSKNISRLVKGEAILLFKDGEFIWENMKIASLSKADLLESLRLQTNGDQLRAVSSAYMETNGRISFVLKNEL